MNHLDIPILRTALISAGEDARRVAVNVRHDDYHPHRYGPGWPVAFALADALTQDRFGHSTICDRIVANDRGANRLARDRAKTRIAWKTELSQALTRLSFDDGAWRAVIDAIADGTAINLYQFETIAEAA